MAEGMRIISADDHVNPPPTMYAERVPKQWRERMPRIERRGDRDLLVFEGTEKPISLLEGSAGVAAKDVQDAVIRGFVKVFGFPARSSPESVPAD